MEAPTRCSVSVYLCPEHTDWESAWPVSASAQPANPRRRGQADREGDGGAPSLGLGQPDAHQGPSPPWHSESELGLPQCVKSWRAPSKEARAATGTITVLRAGNGRLRVHVL